MTVVTTSIHRYIKDPKRKRKLMKAIENDLRAAGYDVEVIDIAESRLRGRKHGDITLFANGDEWFMALMACRDRPTGPEGEDVEVFSDYMLVTEAYIPPRMKCGKLEEAVVITPNDRVYAVPMSVKVLAGLKIRLRDAGNGKNHSV